ncbi:MAG TPA: hypothetical protein VNA15_02495 [Candidatus Angelobacter sp.]|nr:hypothetical protein [Candidatus Angelobacter sp.]
MRVAKGDLTASVFMAIFVIGLFGFLYNTNGDKGWPVLTTMRPLFFLAFAYLLQTQRKSERRWEERSVAFPNPEGGGIIGLYMDRPWYSELAELGKRYKRKMHKCQEKSANLSKTIRIVNSRSARNHDRRTFK